MTWDHLWGFLFLVFPLLLTVVIEVVIATSFRLSQRGVGAVVAVNLVTNPVLTAVIATLAWLGVGWRFEPDSGDLLGTGWGWAELALLEAIIIIAEWRLLVWVLRGSEGSARKLLALAIVMNVVSATLGTFAMRALSNMFI